MKYRIKLFLLTLFSTVLCFAQDEKKETNIPDWVPEIKGTIRAKYEYQPELNAGRFQVRNARFSLSGNVNPIVAYKAEIDLSDEGHIKMLDAYTKLSPISDFDFILGQVRVPFTIDAHRSPHLLYFANRSFIAKQVGNVRDVGAIMAYRFETPFPIILESGIFNGSGLINQQEWHSAMNYSFKSQMFFTKNWNLTLSMQSISPDAIRIFMYDAGMYYEKAGFHFEVEYLYKHYSNFAFSDVRALNSFISYDVKLKKYFKQISFMARYDRMDDHSSGLRDPETKKLFITDYARQRFTGGITLSVDKPFLSDIRLNYEKYFYEDGGIPKESERDKFVIEFVTRF